MDALGQGQPKSQQEVGLSDEHYARYLFITRDVAKDLVKELSQEKERDRYSWTQASLDSQSNAIKSVVTRLSQERIPAVAEAIIKTRLKKAVKDMQRNKKSASEANAASSSEPSVEHQPSRLKEGAYDPIRDV